MSRVLVTGAAGNIGQAVARRLLAESQFELRASDERPVPEWMRQAGEVHSGDLRDLDEARLAIAGCTHVIHLAAIVGGIGNWNALPYTLTEANNALCNAVFGAALEVDIERFVYMSSAMVFERATKFPTPEDYLDECPTPLSPYGFSKLSGEVYTRAAHDEHGLPFTICRPSNAYGPGELPADEPGISHVVPDLIGKVLSGQRPLEIFGSGKQTRTLTHLDDTADGIVTAMTSPAGLNADFNITGSEELTVAEIAAMVWEACGQDPAELELKHVESFQVDVQRRLLSAEKAKRVLGWEPKISVREGIAQTAEWMSGQMASLGTRGSDG
jgi:UDP-glucose 4-epimerase